MPQHAPASVCLLSCSDPNTARIRVAMLRDGIEGREYIFPLKELTRQLGIAAKTVDEKKLLEQASQVASVPDDIVKTQFKMTRDIGKLLARRAQIADMIEKLQESKP